eukprot:TRINITY_DN74448_c0_g1_i1.p1 TRINITY_DN74448_c0_g1~~TRINITY_DN74448_c0_g1_i1.p1  ORF type:complete len:145 (-),score=18.65 TRINITY_DN74448_c0_g1_i1:141-575(-)
MSEECPACEGSGRLLSDVCPLCDGELTPRCDSEQVETAKQREMIFRLDVFGRIIEASCSLRPLGGTDKTSSMGSGSSRQRYVWKAFDVGYEGKKRPCDDIQIPSSICNKKDLIEYLEVLCHEDATPARNSVRILLERSAIDTFQ